MPISTTFVPKNPIWAILPKGLKHRHFQNPLLKLRLRLNRLQTDSGNDFLENRGVWLLLQIRSNGNANWKAFPVDRIWEPKQWKWFSVSIFTSKYFRPWKIKEKERENRSRHHRPLTSSTGVVAPIAISRPIFARSADRSDRDRADHDLADHDLSDQFFLSFVCILRNKWYYIIIW